jgi:hypothetical protein
VIKVGDLVTVRKVHRSLRLWQTRTGYDLGGTLLHDELYVVLEIVMGKKEACDIRVLGPNGCVGWMAEHVFMKVE